MTTHRLVNRIACLALALAAAAGCGSAGSSQKMVDTTAASFESRDEGRSRGDDLADSPQGRSSAPRTRSYEPDPMSAPPAPASASASVTAPSQPEDRGYRVSREPVKAESAPPLEHVQEQRPGLGTTFGETRASQVHDVPFERAGDTPFSVASIFYNDHTGVEAMASYATRRAARLDAPMSMRGGLSVSVVDEAGAPLEALSLGGRVYVAGEAGRRYALVIRNHTNRRYEAVVSVDGLDVVDGTQAATSKRGYLIEPWGSVTIDGYRRNYDEVAAFRFGAVSHSYAARTSPSGDRNVGVIGFAFFGERGVPAWTDNEIERRHTAEPFTDVRFALPPPR